MAPRESGSHGQPHSHDPHLVFRRRATAGACLVSLTCAISQWRSASEGNPTSHAQRLSAANGTMTSVPQKHRCRVSLPGHRERLSSR